MKTYVRLIPTLVVCVLCWSAWGAETVSPDVLGVDVPIGAVGATRALPKGQSVEFALKDIAAGSYHLAVEVRSADVTGEDGKSGLGGYNYLLPKPLYEIGVGGKAVATQISCRPAVRIADDAITKRPIYVGWLLSVDPVELEPGKSLALKCLRDGGFVRRIVLLNEKAWEAEKLRSSDIPEPRGDLGWGSWYRRQSNVFGYKLRTLENTFRALDLFSAGFVKPYIQGEPYAALIAEGKALDEKIKSYRKASGADAAAIEEGFNLARQWQDYFARVEQALHDTVPPIVGKIRNKLDFTKAGITLNEACAAGRDAIFAQNVARQYLDGAEADLKKLGDPQDGAKQRILNVLTYVDNAAEFAQSAGENGAKPQTTVEFPEYATTQPSPAAPTIPSVKGSARSSICLNGLWDFAINTGPDNPPKAGAWPRTQRVPHGEWTFAINKENISDEQWLKGARGYWDWWENNVWYKTEIDVPADWSGRRVTLAFEEIQYYIEVFVNGRYAGNHYGGLIPFEIDVTKYIVPGAGNTLLMFVMDSRKTARPGSTYRYNTHPNLYPVPCYECYGGGIIGDVYLRSTAKVYVDDVYVRTWADKRIRVEATLRNGTDEAAELMLDGIIRKDGKELFSVGRQSILLDPGGEKTVTLENTYPDAQLWGPGRDYGQPENLYYLTTRVADAAGIVDERHTEFGFRELVIKGPDFYLNGQRFPIQGDSLLARCRNYPRRNRWYINQLFRIYRDVNINFTRVHQGGVGPDYAEIGNRTGILLEPEAPWWWIHAPSDIIDQRATPTQREWYESGDNRAMEDPVWRRNCREYYTSVTKRYRNDPCLAISSAENESGANNTVDTIYQFVQWIKEAAPHVIVDSHSLTSATDSRFEIANFHDYDLYVPRMEEWARLAGPNHKPIIIGEFYNTTFNEAMWGSKKREAQAAERAMAKWIERTFRAYQQKLNAGMMYLSFEVNSGTLYSCGDVRTMGPWGDLIEQGKFNSIVYIDWPSLSGRGAPKADRHLFHPMTTLINYGDSSRVAATPTKVAEAFAKAYKPMHDGTAKAEPELIVTVLDKGNIVPGVNVFLVPAGGQATEPIGVKADAKGTAWFVLREPGKYTLAIDCNGKSVRNEITLECTDLINRGGFDYVTRATVDLDRPLEMTVRAGKAVPLTQPAATEGVTSQPARGAIEQGTTSVGPDGFIRDWFVCGPFPSTGGRTDTDKAGWNIDYLKPTGGEAATAPQLGAAYQTEFKADEHAYWENATVNVAWQRYISPEDYIDLGKVFLRDDVRGLDFAPVQFIIGYAACTIDSPVDQDVSITIGSDDGYKMYLNHKLISENRVYREAVKDEEKIDAHLNKGKNLLLVKVDQDIGTYGFFLRILDKADKPLILPVSH